jgi:hypothetical protein
MFLRTGTKAVFISRYILMIISSINNATISSSCDCIERKLFTAVGSELRGTINEGRGTINLTQSGEAQKEKRGISFKDVSFKFLYKLSNLSHGGQRGQMELRVKRDVGRETISYTRIFTDKHTYLLSADSRRLTQT